MDTEPSHWIFFHRSTGYEWRPDTKSALKELQIINNVSPDPLPSLGINVSQPDALLTWLETNSAALISDLTIFVDPFNDAPTPDTWCLLFERLREEATNIQNLSIYWDSEGPTHIGLGRSVVFVRGVARLKVKKSLDIGGFYSKNWPRYLEESMGLRPVNTDNVRGTSWAKLLRNYQRGTEHLDPWKETDDGKFDVPRPWPSLTEMLHTIENCDRYLAGIQK